MTIVAWVLIVLAGVGAVVLPFMIGEKREPYSASIYVSELLQQIGIVALAGRVLGWW